MAFGSFTCDSCGNVSSGEPQESITGRRLCGPCYDNLQGMAAGVIAAGPDATVEEQVGGGIATAGWLARLKAWRRGGSDG